jgi:hypothetical protein
MLLRAGASVDVIPSVSVLWLLPGTLLISSQPIETTEMVKVLCVCEGQQNKKVTTPAPASDQEECMKVNPLPLTFQQGSWEKKLAKKLRKQVQ